jgi:hypothetical protein
VESHLHSGHAAPVATARVQTNTRSVSIDTVSTTNPAGVITSNTACRMASYPFRPARQAYPTCTEIESEPKTDHRGSWQIGNKPFVVGRCRNLMTPDLIKPWLRFTARMSAP